MKTWNVVVDGYGYLGSVQETSEELARCAALSKFGEEGNRDWDDPGPHIYEDDTFSVAVA
jgi:hypothetical protein